MYVVLSMTLDPFPTQYSDTLHHAALCSLHCSTVPYRLLFRVTEWFYVDAEVGMGESMSFVWGSVMAFMWSHLRLEEEGQEVFRADGS